MKSRLVTLGISMFVLCSITSDAHARRGIPIPIFWGSGEEMTELGNLPPDVSSAVDEQLGSAVTVAFLHERVHVFWLDLWTWNGRHVLRAGDRYWEPDATEWKNMIGEEPSAKYGKPFLYRIPLLPALIAVATVGYATRKKFFKTEEEKLTALMNDKRYQASLETIFGDSNDAPSSTVTTTIDEQKFQAARNQLISHGVDAHTAETNLRKISNAILANTNARIDGYLELASQLDREGEWDKSADVYSQVITSLPAGDERGKYAQQCLDSVKEKLGENATQPVS